QPHDAPVARPGVGCLVRIIEGRIAGHARAMRPYGGSWQPPAGPDLARIGILWHDRGREEAPRWILRNLLQGGIATALSAADRPRWSAKRSGYSPNGGSAPCR